jgi:hypothetical protein
VEDLARFADDAAQGRFYSNLVAVRSKVSRETFRFLVTEGPWGGGARGWRAQLLEAPGEPDQHYLVFHTPITVRGIGDKLYELALENDQWIIASLVLETDARGYQVVRHDFDVRFAVQDHKVFIKDKVSMTRGEMAQPTIVLRLGSEYTVRSVSRAGESLPFAQAGGIVMVRAPEAQSFDIDMEYEGWLAAPGFNGYIGPDEAILTGGYWWPHVARQQAPHGVRVQVPKGWTAVGMGELVRKEESPEGTLFQFDMPLPYNYLSLSAGPYTVTERQVGARTCAVCQLRYDEAAARTQLDVLPEMLTFFERFTAYPFTRYAVVASPNYGGPPLSAGSFFTAQPDALPLVSPQTVSQTWWGGMAGADCLRNLWPESFAAYSSGLFFRERDTHHVEEARLAYRLLPDDLDIAEHGGVQFATPERGEDARRLAQGKGAIALQVLEWEIGTDAMMTALRSFVANAPVLRSREWEHFQFAASEIAGQDLQWFFDEWVRFTGSARLELESVRLRKSSEGYSVSGGIQLSGLIRQLTVPIGLIYEDGTVEERRVGVRGLRARFSLDTDRPPQLLVVDPYLRLYREVAPEELPPMVCNLSKDAWVIVPDDMSARILELRRKIEAFLGAATIKTESEVTLEDTTKRDVIYYGSGSHPTLWDLAIQFPIWEKDGRVHLGDGAFETAQVVALAALRNPLAPTRLVGRMFGGSQLQPLTYRASAIICDRLGRPLRAQTLPIKTGPLACDLRAQQQREAP